MKLIKYLSAFFLLLLVSNVSWSFDVMKHDAETQQKIIAIDFQKEGFSYIFEKSLDVSRASQRKYGVMVNSNKILLPIVTASSAIKHAGFLKDQVNYKAIYLIDGEGKNIILGVLPTKKDKGFFIKEIAFPESIDSLDRVIPIDGKLLFIVGDYFSSSVYSLDMDNYKFKKIELLKNEGKGIYDYLIKDGKTYVLSISEGKTVYFTIYNEDMTIVEQLVYSKSKIRFKDGKIMNSGSSEAAIVLRGVDPILFKSKRDLHVYAINFDLLKNKPDALKELFTHDFRNSDVMKSLLYCKSTDTYFWPDKKKRKVNIKSSKMHDFSIKIPEYSFPYDVFTNFNNNELNVVVNFEKRTGKYSNMGFGNDSIFVKCQ